MKLFKMGIFYNYNGLAFARYACLYAVLWVAADCLLAFSWMFQEGTDIQRTWHAFVFPMTAVGCALMLRLWTGEWLCTLPVLLLAFVPTIVSLNSIDVLYFTFPDENRPLFSWFLLALSVGVSFTIAYLMTPYTRYITGSVLLIASLWSFFGAFEITFCGQAPAPFTDPSVCAGVLDRYYRPLMFSFLGSFLLVSLFNNAKRKWVY